MESLEQRRVLTGLPYGAMESDLGEFMLGTVAVTPVLLESNGAIDQDTEEWTNDHIEEVLDNLETGLDWWEDTLALQSTVHNLEFQVDTTYALNPVESSYEPISRRSNDYFLWVSEFLDTAGYGDGNIESGIREFNQDQREKLGTDWSFTIFVVPSVNDLDGQFQSGGSFNRAFAFAGGLFFITPSTRPASTYTHETGHMFWARDEYPGGGSYFQRRGYYNTQNENAADNPNPGFEQEPSIMAAGSLLQTAYENQTSPASTLAMVGWQDSDGDGIFDVMDVPHRLAGTGWYNVEANNYRFVGEAHVQTLPNLNPEGLGNDITLNRISRIEYRFDGGDWQTAETPDAHEVDLDLTIPVPDNSAEIEIRAIDTATGIVSNQFIGRLPRVDMTLVPGINGTVWVDANRNSTRDVGEYGAPLWQVELVDGDGNRLDLQESVEPDDYQSGVLESNFSDLLTLNAVGTDADGRVGLYADSLASTGSMVFHGFSRASQSFQPTWNATSRRLQADFSSPQTAVRIDAIGSGSNSFGRLEAYNSSGQLLGRYTTNALGQGDVETMVIQRGAADIAYVIASGHAFSNVRLDNLRFGPESSVRTGDLGEFQFAALPAGDYLVKVTPPSDAFAADSPSSGILSAQVSSNTATADIDFGFRAATSQWQNPDDRNDVNEDQFVTPLDALLIINQLNQNGSRDLRDSGYESPPYVDVNGDSWVTPLDVLLVINYINANGSGEGENSSSHGVQSVVQQAPPRLPIGTGSIRVDASDPTENGNLSAPLISFSSWIEELPPKSTAESFACLATDLAAERQNSGGIPQSKLSSENHPKHRVYGPATFDKGRSESAMAWSLLEPAEPEEQLLDALANAWHQRS